MAGDDDDGGRKGSGGFSREEEDWEDVLRGMFPAAGTEPDGAE